MKYTNWCVRGTNISNNKNIQNYLNNLVRDRVGFYDYYYYFIKDNILTWEKTIPLGYTLITFEEFINNIVNKNINYEIY